MTKYGARPVIWDVGKKQIVQVASRGTIRFDSTFEFNVYQQLVSLVGVRNIKMQVPLRIKPGSDVYSEINWKCDFRVYKQNDLCDYLNIEAKGTVTREFKRNVKYLELFSPTDFNRLMVIGTSDKPVWLDKNIQMWSLHEAIQFLSIDGWKQSTNLPPIKTKSF